MIRVTAKSLIVWVLFFAFVTSPVSAQSIHTYGVVFGDWAIESDSGASLGFIQVFEVSTDAPGFSGELFRNAGFFDSAAEMTGSVRANPRQAFVFDITFQSKQSGEQADGRLLLSLKGTNENRLQGSIEIDNRYVVVTLQRQFKRGVIFDPVPDIVEEDFNDLPGTGVTGPAYRLRNVPEGRALRVRASNNRSSSVVGQLPATEQDMLVMSCAPQIDPVRFDQSTLEGKRKMLGGVWCEMETRNGLRGYVLGRYLDPMVDR
ncbi:MAG: SH3 domain-containing protein [Pseudomonadota bacterium]